MNEIFKTSSEISENIGEIVKERFFSPMYFYFITSWVLWNWKFVVGLFFVEQSFLKVDKITYLKEFYEVHSWFYFYGFINFGYLWFFCKLLVFPAVSSYVAVWWLSILSEKFFEKYEQFKLNKKIILKKLEYSEKVVYQEEQTKLREAEYNKGKILYDTNKYFNQYLDGFDDSISVAQYKFKPSEVLYNNDYLAYVDELNSWNEAQDAMVEAAGDEYIQNQIDIARGR